MKQLKRISLFTLLGLILPLGNIWGPLLVNVSRGSKEAIFRDRLICLECMITIICFVISIAILVKSMNSDLNTHLFLKAMYALLIEDIAIILIAVLSPYWIKSK